MDIELYNYIDCVFRDYRAGNLVLENKKKGSQLMQEEEQEKGALRLNAGVVFQVMGSGPGGFIYKRDNADVMNNFFVNIVTRSFTNIEEIYRQLRDNKEVQKQQEVLTELEVVKGAWKNIISQECTDNYDRFDKNISESKKTLE